ncbi:Multiple C2 and transmembrane domain-containing protein 1 [Cichlidogyrus casuarinus]|uniref:Multiple C2 and transmembrane domain-containing protein 1 n=1 Tax=Cichlidogyrus casuarinus TaxID=1844966 RepID=A0ABD2PVP3_9PLAT
MFQIIIFLEREYLNTRLEGFVDVCSLPFDLTQKLEVGLDSSGPKSTITILITLTGLSNSKTPVQQLPKGIDDSDLASDLLQDASSLDASLLDSSGEVDDEKIHALLNAHYVVLRARNLDAKDISGRSDPFVIAQLPNRTVRTHTIYKNLDPEWMRCYVMPVADIHQVLTIIVYDEDKDGSMEFIGQVMMPLLQMEQGKKQWYRLKNERMDGFVRGVIQLETKLIYNTIKAGIKTVKRIEQDFLEPEVKFRLAVGLLVFYPE